MEDHYEVVVVGSGYGGSIAASRLARAGREVCLLEQGKELQPGEYPNTLLEATAELQAALPEFGVHHGSRMGLYDLHAGKDINVFKGCGLGGTSLVNANVSIKPDKRVFEEYNWPKGIQAEAAEAVSPLWAAYDRAIRMLGANPYPTNPSDLDKLNALEQSADRMGAGDSFHRTYINVTFDDKVSSGGVWQKRCTRCGDCMSGCNYRAKNTTLMNYLPDAVRHGAVIFTKCSVRYLERERSGWAIWFQRLESGQEDPEAPPRKLTADIVVLAGGSLGSTEILLRSKQRGLALSDQVGKGFSGNGDVLAFGYDVDPPINGMGWGRVPPGRLPLVGPCITGVIDLRDPNAPLTNGMIIQEGSIAGAISTFMPEAMAIISRLSAQQPLQGAPRLPRPLSELESLALGPHHGALQHTQVYLAMAHDGGDGVMGLNASNQLEISWPSVGQRPIFTNINQRLQDATTSIGGVFVENPLWAVDFLSKNLTTVHPLGGCRMANTAADGVVNADCQAFSSSAGEDVHDNLYVVDGAVVPSPLGVNPSLTISALAERAMAKLAADRSWSINYESAPDLPSAGRAVGADFTEQWRGQVADGATVALQLSVVARNLDALLNDAQYGAEVHGSAVVTNFNLTQLFTVIGRLSTAPGQVVYDLVLSSAETKYSLTGRRSVPGEAQENLFGAVASLTIQSHDHPEMSGTLHCLPADLLNELGSLRIYNSNDDRVALRSTDALSVRLTGPLADVYGKISGLPTALAPGAEPLKRRTLLAPAPEADYFMSSDGRLLRLLRYPSEGRPILLVHGLGQSSRLFALGSMQPNLVEFLNKFHLDVWLLDNRGSIELPGALEPFSLDQIAAIDLPQAVERIEHARGAADVALFAHGWGSAAAWMYLLSGGTGIAAFVSSQIHPFVDVPLSIRVAAELRTDDIWRKLGAHVLGGFVPDAGLVEGIWKLLSHGDDSRREAVIERIEAIYGDVLIEENLSERVDAALGYLYGPVSIAAASQVQAIARAQRLVDSGGNDRYLAGHLPGIPILLVQGLANRLSLRSGLDKSRAWLRQEHQQNPFVASFAGYGQDDCILGHQAPQDVFPSIARFLEDYRNG